MPADIYVLVSVTIPAMNSEKDRMTEAPEGIPPGEPGMSESSEDLPLGEQHDRNAKLVGGYFAFVAALLAVVFAKSNEYPLAWLVISLLAVSLPSLSALVILDFRVRVADERKVNRYLGLAAFLGFSPSIIAIAILVGHFSVVAAILFLLLVGFWCPVILAAAGIGHRDAP
jgi:hypothetical protein